MPVKLRPSIVHDRHNNAVWIKIPKGSPVRCSSCTVLLIRLLMLRLLALERCAWHMKELLPSSGVYHSLCDPHSCSSIEARCTGTRPCRLHTVQKLLPVCASSAWLRRTRRSWCTRATATAGRCPSAMPAVSWRTPWRRFGPPVPPPLPPCGSGCASWRRSFRQAFWGCLQHVCSRVLRSDGLHNCLCDMLPMTDQAFKRAWSVKRRAALCYRAT